ncbi:MAG: glycine dehydrogenase (aminomethyl-transferring) [Armatimonadetes bacterium CG_4_10_14_3_um_filter_66_18]|nr:MAG: glycine dehydrogenase (aminomethyl-transferring) [Armatimonadetes bacterium CG_4_10_14_3_um_filter_66_18]
MKTEPLIHEYSAPGRGGRTASVRSNYAALADVPLVDLDVALPADRRRKTAVRLPEVEERTVVQHFTRLSQRNFSVDTHFYPLGSCTMKYNPKLNERVAALAGLTQVHPLQDPATMQGWLAVLHALQEALAEIGGMDAVTLQPAAGAQGEFLGLLLIHSYHEKHGEEDQRRVILIPDSAHGTNPASAARCGYETVSLASGADGCLDLEALKRALGDDTAGLMLTNPNTFGLFEKHVAEAARLVHEAGGLVYYDGANMNAIMGKAKPGDMGCDVMHFNLHKTFSTPHGGGGPGAGPVGVKSLLEPFLPVPVVERHTDGYVLNHDRPDSIGKVHAFHGNAGVLLRAYAYILSNGGEGLTQVTERAVLNANYLLSLLSEAYDRPFGSHCKHEFVVSARRLKGEKGIRALDVAKRLIDLGFHPPTVYFPIVMEEALMVEPTETETKAVLDAFADALNQVAEEAAESPDCLHEAPITTPVSRLDEATAARKPNLRYRWPDRLGEGSPE